MTIDGAIQYILDDPIRTLAQIPAYALLIGLPAWLIYRWQAKKYREYNDRGEKTIK